MLLGQVVEQVTGQARLAGHPASACWTRSGSSTRRTSPTSRRPGDAAHGHLWGGGTTFIDQTGSEPRAAHHVRGDGRGRSRRDGLQRRADLARWAMALYATDRVVPPELLAADARLPQRDEYGLGTRTRIFNGRRAIGHGGSLRGYEDGMWYFPREGAVIVLLSNRGLYNPDRTIRELRQDALEAHRRAGAASTTRSRNTD